MDTTHEVFNQPTPLVDYNLFDTNRPLRDALKFNAPALQTTQLHELGATLGSAGMQAHARLANIHTPELHTHDRFGRRIDEVEFQDLKDEQDARKKEAEKMAKQPFRDINFEFDTEEKVADDYEQGQYINVYRYMTITMSDKNYTNFTMKFYRRNIHKSHETKKLVVEESEDIWCPVEMD